MTTLTLNLSYRNPSTDALESNPLGGGTFIPLRKVSFNNLANNQSVVNTANDPGSEPFKRFDSVLGDKGFQGGYGVRATTSVATTGANSCCKMTIPAGSDGDPSDAGAGYGAWGGKFSLDSADWVSEGQKIWFQKEVMLPVGFNGQTGAQGYLKFLRVNHDGFGCLDMHILTGEYDSSAPAGQQIGWTFTCEWAPGSQSDSHRKTQKILTLGSFHVVEQYIKASVNPNLAERILWVDGNFVMSLIGNQFKWIDQSGVLQTSLVSGVRTLDYVGDTLQAFQIFSYWNFYSPIDNTAYLQYIAYHKNESEIPNVDAYGNKMIGLGEITV